jgi:GNAT superfamily N-acetyltransferase
VFDVGGSLLGVSFVIRPLVSADVDAVVEFSVRAWAPVFASFEAVLGADIYARVCPDWLSSQARDVAQVRADHAATTWVAVDGTAPVGFVAVILQSAARSGDIEMIAVDPAHQRQGIADALISFALDQLRAAGAEITGGDPGHAPARRGDCKNNGGSRSSRETPG